MGKRENNVYEFDPKRRRRPKAGFNGERLRPDRRRNKPGGAHGGYENLVRNRRLKAFAIFLAIVAAYVLVQPLLGGLTLGR